MTYVTFRSFWCGDSLVATLTPSPIYCFWKKVYGTRSDGCFIASFVSSQAQ
jgi:hypothetical protein